MNFNNFNTKKTLKIKNKIIFFNRPLLMGIINLSEDSFYKGSISNSLYEFENKINEFILAEADIIDIGAASSRPGSDLISPKNEYERLKPYLPIVKKYSNNVLFSIDSYNSEIVKLCVNDFGFSIINDISGYNVDPKMFETILSLNVPYILMHMKGIPSNMQDNPTYEDILNEIYSFFYEKIKELNSNSFTDIIIDPGFGFGKTLKDNYLLLKNLSFFKTLGYPILVGISRKSMIYKLLNSTPDEVLNETVCLNTFAILNSADIIRVHDVAIFSRILFILNFINDL